MKKASAFKEASINAESSPEKIADEIRSYQYPEKDERFEEELEHEFGHHSSLKASRARVRALRTFRNACPSIKNTDPKNLSVYVIHPEPNGRLDFAPARAFGVAPEHISYILQDGTRAAADTYKKRTHADVHKGSAEHHQLPKPVDIVVVMDPTVRPTNKLLSNTKPGHWILWPLKNASALRAKGYMFKGIIEHGRAFPSVDKRTSEFWKELEVKTDEELEKASKNTDEGIVTYEEAKGVVRKVYGNENNIVERYKKLIQQIEEEYPERIKEGKTTLENVAIDMNGKTIELNNFNTVLPLKEREYDERDFAIFKKKGV